MAMVGMAPSIVALWIYAKNAQRQLESQIATANKDDDQQDESIKEPSESEQTLEQVQEWFQRNIWPGSPTGKPSPPFPQTLPK